MSDRLYDKLTHTKEKNREIKIEKYIIKNLFITLGNI